MRFKNWLEGIRSTASLPVDQRLESGWAAEDVVIAVLNRFIGPTVKASRDDDRGNSKLDAVVSVEGEDVKVQIKTRESGDDILVEWYKSYPNVLGRDRITKAQAYAVMDSARQWVFICDAAAVKKVCEQLEKEWEAAGMESIYRSPKGHEVKIQSSYDREGEKMMIYLKPKILAFEHPYPGIFPKIGIPKDLK